MQYNRAKRQIELSCRTTKNAKKHTRSEMKHKATKNEQKTVVKVWCPWQSAPYADSVRDVRRPDLRITTRVLTDTPSQRGGQ